MLKLLNGQRSYFFARDTLVEKAKFYHIKLNNFKAIISSVKLKYKSIAGAM
jgi:hypothetical protein